jgi:ribosomal protein L7/L12
VPDEVVELAASGDRLGAIKRFRELTGASFGQASEVVDAL